VNLGFLPVGIPLVMPSGPPATKAEKRFIDFIDNQLIPLSNYGVKSMSMGYLVGEEAPVAWRGLMVMKAMNQMLNEVEWGGLDVLVLDLPPGTGDVQLSITQQVIVDGVYGSHSSST